MHRRLLWITGAVAVLAFAVHRWGLASATSKSNATATNEGRLPADSVDGQRLLALEREVRSLRAELSSARREREPEPAAREEVPALEQAPGEEALPKSPLADDEREAVAAAAFYQSFSDRVDTEIQDPAWRRRVEGDISAILPQQLGPDIRVTEANCASTTCRVRLTHAGVPQIPAEQMMKLARNRGPLGDMEWHLDVREEGKTTIYMTRSTPTP